ncbi:hypothetical protein [Deinococcus hopiensis]|uniref:Uncharacterized protein n=1 Tax=Deinococcus hopiensis KR-140 TaxID=695939 RepID=A0A1W1UXV5_9DEIO|nr:hypothetical protein [Deinococcus hopiensis]SMB85820.1 hypothetical protein SAMN00790413_03554 [Deinococcus hopiensis KR-140]
MRRAPLPFWENVHIIYSLFAWRMLVRGWSRERLTEVIAKEEGKDLPGQYADVLQQEYAYKEARRFLP